MTDPADAYAARQLERLRATVPTPWAPEIEPTLLALARASDFAIETLLKQPTLVDALASNTPTPPLVLSRELRSEWPAMLRRYRTAESTRLIWRDVAGLDDVDATLAGSTRLAETCLQSALAALEGEFAERFGVVRATDGSVQRLVVFGLGKLGGGELNFSSDVDLVYAYPQDGESDGTRALAAEDHFARLGQQLAKLLDETTADGFCASRRPAPAPLRQRRARGACRSRAWSSTSSAKAAIGNAMHGRRRGRWRATSPRASASSKPCGPSSIAAISTTARSTACAK